MVDGNPTTPITILNLSSRKNITEARDCQNGLKNNIQEYLRHFAGLVPDHQNKVNIAIKKVAQISWFPSAYESYVYTIAS